MKPKYDVSKLALILTAVLGCSFNVPRGTYGANFASADEEIVRAAEAARESSARFWSGQALPGDWFRACPIAWHPQPGAASGRTRFQFANGNVFGWQMEVWGNREEVLRDVIPHEVDHMVRASLVRHPIVRWLDEGCASLMESDAVRRQLRNRARILPAELISARWLECREYPLTSEETGQLYALGYSLVEFLMEQGSPAQLMELQAARGSVVGTLQTVYGLSVSDLRQQWNVWRLKLAEEPVPDSFDTTDGQRAELVIWTAAWCPACQAFWQDLSRDAKLGAELRSRYILVRREFDRHTGEATRQGIRQLPCFVVHDRTWVGYSGPQDFLARLATIEAALARIDPAVPEPEDAGSDFQQSTSPHAEQADTGTPVPPTRLVAEDAPTPTRSVEEDRAKGQDASQVPPSAQTSAAKPSRERPSESSFPWLRVLVPLTFDVLQWTGIVGGTALGGGLGGLVVFLGWTALKALRLRMRRSSASTAPSPFELELERSAGTISAPFPRSLDEARELLALRQPEGRVAVLDALRGMFLDDELDKLTQSTEPSEVKIAARLKGAIDGRVAEVAPLSVDLSK